MHDDVWWKSLVFYEGRWVFNGILKLTFDGLSWKTFVLKVMLEFVGVG